jgi:cyclic nucleotide-binding protein
MGVGEIIGYLAAAVTVGTYSMKTMIPLRVCGIAANILFIGFATLNGIYPTLILHAVLLPLNSVRLYQMVQLIKRVSEASRGDRSLDWLKPYMSARRYRKGDMLFRKGDVADTMFYVVAGQFRLTESGLTIAPAQIIGELGLLAPDHRRTQSLECIEDGEVLTISYDHVKQLYFQNPSFGFYFMSLTTSRLFQNLARLEKEHELLLPTR